MSVLSILNKLKVYISCKLFLEANKDLKGKKRHSGEIDERDVLGEIGEHGERDVLGVLLVSLIHLQRLMKYGIFPPLSFADHS